MLTFLHDNAMQVAGFLQAALGLVLVFTHFTPPQTAALAAFPAALGTFLAGIALSSYNGNGNGKAPPAPKDKATSAD